MADRAPQTTTTPQRQRTPNPAANTTLQEPPENEGDAADKILKMALVSEEQLVTEEGELPLLGFDNTTIVEGGNLTDLGFPTLVKGSVFRGYMMEVVEHSSQFGEEKPVLDDKQQPIVVDGKPITKKTSPIIRLYGTLQIPMGEGFVTAKGRIKLRYYDRLVAPFEENKRLEDELTAKAKKKNPQAGRVRVPVEIAYLGKNPDRVKQDGSGEKARSGAHLFTVQRIQEATAK